MKEHRTRLHACSVEHLDWVGDGELFACGTYELDESSNSRQGEIVIFDQTSAISATICESGVLDMKVVKNIVCVALSTGGLVLYKVVNAFNLELHASTCEPDEGLFLSIDVDNKLLDTCWEVATKIAVSTQLGSILIYEYIPSQHDENVILRKTGQISGAHSMFGEVMPAWIVFFDPHSKCRLISGGDDCVMKMWNLLTEAESSTVADTFLQIYETPAASNRKAHTAGVTSGQWHPHFRHLFASGSYDEHVRIWDGRDFSRPLLDIYTGGGIWRVKWFVGTEPESHYLVLACMHGGCRVYHLDIQVVTVAGTAEEIDSEKEEEQRYIVTELGNVHQIDENNDKHLAYGVDVLSALKGAEGETVDFTIASCSFYDNLVQVWNCKL